MSGWNNRKELWSLHLIMVTLLSILLFLSLSVYLSVYPSTRVINKGIFSISIIRNSQNYFHSPFSSLKFHGNGSSTRGWNGNQWLALCSSVIRPIRSLPQMHLSALKSPLHWWKEPPCIHEPLLRCATSRWRSLTELRPVCMSILPWWEW